MIIGLVSFSQSACETYDGGIDMSIGTAVAARVERVKESGNGGFTENTLEKKYYDPYRKQWKTKENVDNNAQTNANTNNGSGGNPRLMQAHKNYIRRRGSKGPIHRKAKKSSFDAHRGKMSKGETKSFSPEKSAFKEMNAFTDGDVQVPAFGSLLSGNNRSKFSIGNRFNREGVGSEGGSKKSDTGDRGIGML